MGDPVIDSFSPASGVAYSAVTIRGSFFQGATQVAFGGVPSPAFWVRDGGEIQAAVPPGAPAGPISVMARGREATSAGSFTLVPGPPPALELRELGPIAAPPGAKIRLGGSGFFAVNAVEFSGVPASFTWVSDGEILATVPPGAPSGPITVRNVAGASSMSVTFTVSPGSAAEATITSVRSSDSGLGVIEGTNLSSVIAVYLADRPTVFTLGYLGQIYFSIPSSEPRSGPVRIVTPLGDVVYPQPFEIPPQEPRVVGMTPSQGPEGTPVTLSGAALAGPREILFGGVRATSVLASSFGSIKVLVPSGAKSGPVTVVTAGGRKDAPASFTVVAGTGTQDLQIAGMYVTQAIQRMDGSIPLVAGREGRLRVFLACSGPNALSPMVRVTVWDASGAAVLTRDIPAPFPMVPMAVEESDPLGSWDVTLPGSLIQPGMTVQARILPLPGGPALDPARSAFPAGGPMALEVRQVAPLGITLIPVNQGGTTGLVTNRDRSLESWLKLARKVYPLGEVDIRQGEVFTARESLLPGFDLSYSSLRNDLDRARIVANPASRRYHVGVFRPPFLNTMMGIAQWSTAGSNLSRSCLVWDGTAIGSSWSHVETLAHELGHNLLRRHSNCGIDHPTEYPYPDAELGAYGFDVETGESFHPKLCKDLMSYCNPYWVSDHTYQGVLEDRAAELPFLSSPSSPKEGLLVSGIIRNGKVTLDPAFEVDGVSDQPDPGNYLLRLKDALGNVIQETSFAPTLLMDFSFTEMVYSFCFAIPLTPAIKAGLGSMEVVPKGARAWAQAGPSAALFTASPRGTSLPRDPVAVVWHPGTVHLSWDGETHPQVMVRNAATGAAIGLVEGGSAELVTEAGELDLDLSSGLSSVRTRVKVAR